MQLKKIAKLYKIHISIFYLPEPPTDFQPLTDYRVLPERLATDEEQIYRLNANIVEAFERRETLIELYELLEEPPPDVTLNVNRHDNLRRSAQKITRAELASVLSNCDTKHLAKIESTIFV